MHQALQKNNEEQDIFYHIASVLFLYQYKEQVMKKSILMSVSIITVMFMSGCSSKEVQPIAAIEGECIIAGEVGPNWACGAYEDEGTFASVGSAQISKLGHGFSRRESVANARSSLAQQVQTTVKDKVETFMRSTGTGEQELADKVTTQVSKQVAKQTLNGAKQISYWENTSDNSIYVLVSADKDSINKAVKASVISSYKNEDV